MLLRKKNQKLESTQFAVVKKYKGLKILFILEPHQNKEDSEIFTASTRLKGIGIVAYSYEVNRNNYLSSVETDSNACMAFYASVRAVKKAFDSKEEIVTAYKKDFPEELAEAMATNAIHKRIREIGFKFLPEKPILTRENTERLVKATVEEFEKIEKAKAAEAAPAPAPPADKTKLN